MVVVADGTRQSPPAEARLHVGQQFRWSKNAKPPEGDAARQPARFIRNAEFGSSGAFRASPPSASVARNREWSQPPPAPLSQLMGLRGLLRHRAPIVGGSSFEHESVLSPRAPR
jgi:hypothetical protein